MTGKKQKGTAGDKSGPAAGDGQPGGQVAPAPAVPEPLSFPDTLPMPAPDELPPAEDKKPKG